jgi:hypothetical protein
LAQTAAIQHLAQLLPTVVEAVVETLLGLLAGLVVAAVKMAPEGHFPAVLVTLLLQLQVKEIMAALVIMCLMAVGVAVEVLGK